MWVSLFCFNQRCIWNAYVDVRQYYARYHFKKVSLFACVGLLCPLLIFPISRYKQVGKVLYSLINLRPLKYSLILYLGSASCCLAHKNA